MSLCLELLPAGFINDPLASVLDQEFKEVQSFQNSPPSGLGFLSHCDHCPLLSSKAIQHH